MPVCQKCGARLEIGREQDFSWKKTLRDDRHGTEYYRMDDDGYSDATQDARDTLAEEMAELKTRKAEGMRRQRRLRRDSASRGIAPSGMTIRTNQAAQAYWATQETPRVTAADEEAARTEAAAGQPEPEAAGRAGSGAAVRMIGSRSETVRADAGGSRTAVRYTSAPITDVTPAQALAQEPEMWDTSRNWDPLWAEQEAYGTRWQQKNPHEIATLPNKKKAWRRFLRVVGVLFVAALLGLTGFFGYHYYQDRQAEIREQNRATVVASMLDDLAAHTIMIPGEDGSQIYIRELHTAYIVADGFATVEVADHTWYDNLEDLTDPSMEVTLTPFLKTASGRQQPLEPISYTIDIPVSPIRLITPDGDRVQVASAMYTMVFEVRPGSKVYINDKEISDTINNDTGEISYNATIQPIGDNVFTLRCRSQYCRETRMTITVYREPQEIPLDLAADTYTSTSLKAMQVNCTTLPGATIEVLSPYSDLNITNLDSTGSFSFYALFETIGNNIIEINASYPGKKTSHIEYTVYYLPPEMEYSKKAWPLSAEGYSELVGNMTFRASRSQVYVVMGTLQYFISEKPQLAVFNTSEDGQSQPVVVQNYTRTTWEKGKWYRIYADAEGMYNNMPRLNGRFTHTD